MRIVMIAVMLALWLSAPCWSDNGFKEGAREVGQGFKDGSKKVGQGIKDLGKEFKEVGKEAGHGFKKAGQEAGQEAKKTGRSIGEWFRDTGKKTGDSFRELGRNIRKFFTGNQQNDYTSKDGKSTKVFDTLEWLVNLCSCIPNRGVEIVICYGFCNTVRDYSSSANHHFNADLKSEDLVGGANNGIYANFPERS